MSSTAPHLEFAPPRTGGSLRALGLAIIAHGLLLVALTVGVQWKSDPVQQTFEAELWSAVPTEAAPPPPVPETTPEPPKPVEPEVKPIPVTRPDAVVKAEAEIAIAKEKEKERAKELKRLALEKQEQEKQLKAEAEKEKQERLKKEQLEKDKQAKLDQQRKQDQQAQANAAKERADRVKQLEKLAGAGNGANSSSTAAESKALSDSYKGRIRALMKRFHTYTETVAGNPVTEVEVRTSSDGTIISRKIIKFSGNKSWDDSVVNAIDKAERLPLDENGRSPSPITISWSGQDMVR